MVWSSWIYLSMYSLKHGITIYSRWSYIPVDVRWVLRSQKTIYLRLWDSNTDISTNVHMIWYIRCSNPDVSTCAHRTRSIRGSNIDESTCLPRLRSIRGIALQDQILDSSGHDCLGMDYVILISMTARYDPSRGKIRKDGKDHYIYVR